MTSQTDAQLPMGSGETILVVDDEQMLRTMGKFMLSHAGYSVLEAENGEKALERYDENSQVIQLVLLDLTMPGMGGVRCLEKLLEINPEVKVIISSGYSSDGMLAKCLEMGAKDFIGKPSSRADLLKTVRKVLDM